MDNKFPEEERTFETRLKFLNEIFTNKFTQRDIMAHCIVHKLDRSFLIYSEDLRQSSLYLTGKDPLSIMRKMKDD